MSRPISQADAVMAVYPEWISIGPSREPKILFVAWPDGRVVWSRDRLFGGPPYLQSNVDPELVVATLARFQYEGLFDCDNLSGCYAGPDAPYTTILLRYRSKRLEMSSAHEPAEAKGGVVTSHGSGGHYLTLVQALEQEPAEYLHFRLFWSEIRRRLDELIPTSGLATIGRPQGINPLSWWEP